jgi:hypothetical protein
VRRVGRGGHRLLIECSADDGEPPGQAFAVVRTAGGNRCARDACVHSRLACDLEAHLRRRSPRVTEQSQSPDQQDAAGQQPSPSPPAGEPEAPVAPPPPTIPLEPSASEGAAPAVEPLATPPLPGPAPPAPPPTAPLASRPDSAPPLGAPLAAADGSPPSSPAEERPELLAGAAFVGGFLVALILKRLAS